MWNKAASKGWKEADQDFAVENPAIVSSPEVSGSNLGTKRQRRPSVRLEEIGDRPAAIVAEKRRKKIAFFPCPGKRTPKLEAEEPLESTCKVLKVRPLVNVNSGNFSHDGTDVERHNATPSEVAPPCPSTPVDFRHQELQTTLCDASDERPSPSHFLKTVSKKGRNGNRKRGGLKVAVSAKRFTSAGGSLTRDEEPIVKDAIEMHIEEVNEAHTPEGFRDCDLETSDYCNDGKDVSNSIESKPSKNGDLSPVQGEVECQYRLRYQNGSPRQGHDFEERINGLAASAEVSEKGLTELNEEFTLRNRNGEACATVWAGTPGGTYGKDSQNLGDTSRLPQADKLQPNELQESMEAPLPRNKTNLHFAKRHPPLLWNGVRSWLQNLGLGKYAQQFEAHEVDIEVLPLLTFDDLKEMGITAVGSRRKLFFAIQQLGKCLLIRAD